MPVQRNTLVQSVVEQLVALIKEGSLAPGDHLPSERDLMKRLGVGRSTVREALRSLVIMGLVDQRPGQGCTVKSLSVETVIRPDLLTSLLDRSVTVDLLEVRKLIEPATAELAAQRATAGDLAELQAVMDRCRAAHAAGMHTAELSALLHLTVARAAHNGVLVMFMESILGLLTDRGDQLEHIAGYTDWEIASHQRIVDAIEARDPRRAHRLMARHLDESVRQLLEQDSNRSPDQR